jgi:tight adherence protein B
MSSRSLGGRAVLAAAATTAATILLGSSAAWAAPEGRIQEVTSQPGTVTFVLSAEGLAEGESINSDSVKATIGGVDAPTTASSISDATEAPVARTTMLVLDSSGSMAEFGKLDTAKDAANQYLDGLPADVSAGLIAFADEAEVRVPPTQDRESVRAAIADLTAEGSTALNDAVALGVRELGNEGSRNIVLLSDGEDEGSETSAKKARTQLAESGVVLDAVSAGEGSQEEELAAFAEAGNGSLITATDAATLTSAFEAAARSVDTQLAVTAEVPEGIEAGTSELTVVALVGDQQITDTTAALITPAAEPTPTESASGPIAVPRGDPGVFGQPLFLMAVITAIFISLAAITSLAVGAIDTKNRKEGRVTRRLEEVSVIGGSAPRVDEGKPQTVLGEGVAVRKVVSFADRVAASRDTTALARRLEAASVSLRPGEWAVVHGLIAVLAGLLTTLLTNFNLLVSALAFVAGLILPWLYLGFRADKRRKDFYQALPDSMQLLSGSLSAGYSLPQALDTTAKESGGPLGEEVNRALLESRLGLPIEESLEGVAQRMESKDFHWVVMAIRINRKVGGNLAEVLATVGQTLRERERLRRQVKALSAEGVLSGWILGLLPIIVLVAIFLLRPDYMLPMFTQPVGWLMLAVGLVLYIAGIIWMRNLINMEV